MITDEEILSIVASIAKCFKVLNCPFEELQNEGFVAAKEALLLNSSNPSYRYAISKRIKGSLIDYISSNKHTSLPANADGLVEDILDVSSLSEQDNHSYISPETVIKIIRMCPFYEEKRLEGKPLVGRGMELLWDRFVFGMSVRDIGYKYNAAPQSIRIRIDNLLFQLRSAIFMRAKSIKE